MSEAKSVQQENRMGTMPVNQLLLSMSLPMMASMLIQALYNIVDSMFVAQINENALAAVSLAFPVQNLMIAVASGTGVGINALLSRSLGERKFDQANRSAMNGIFLAGCSFVAFALLGIFFAGLFFRVQTTDAEIVSYGVSYVRIITICSFGMYFQVCLEKLLQSTGKSFYSMITQGTGAIINIILDPILIFGLFGFPRLETMGAAIATVTGQTVAAMLALIFNLKKNTELKFSFRGFKPEIPMIKRIYSVGFPSIIMISISSVMNFGMNKILLGFNSTATVVFGVYYKLQSFVFMPIMGLNSGMVPIIAYNYGARKRERITKTIKLSVIYAVAIMLVGFLLFQLIPGTLLSIFNASEYLLEIGVPALRTISFSFLFAGYCIVCSSVFQSLGHGFLSLMVSLIRQLVVLLPAAFVFSRLGGLNMVWYAFPLSELISLVLCTFFLSYMYKAEINRIPAAKGK